MGCNSPGKNLEHQIDAVREAQARTQGQLRRVADGLESVMKVSRGWNGGGEGGSGELGSMARITAVQGRGLHNDARLDWGRRYRK